MANHKLREDKTCQNCGYVVRKRFCPKCGQENIETRQSFHYLFTHFVEDLVHYDGSFWKTLKNLLFKPGILTREYLKGKRKEFVAPVKLYIFISFFVFFVGGIINKFTAESNFENVRFTTNDDTILLQNQPTDSLNLSEEEWTFSTNEKTLREYDSIQNSLPENLKDTGFDRVIKRKEIELKQKYTLRELKQKVIETAQNNIPKFLFLYMPFFAFFMWLFHSKKKWYYFEHGIFMLHYFSFLLLSFFTTFSIIGPLSKCFDHWFIDIIFFLVYFTIYAWMFIYFFKAHRKVYQYSRIATIFRGLFLLFLNMTFLLFGIVVYMFIIFSLI